MLPTSTMSQLSSLSSLICNSCSRVIPGDAAGVGGLGGTGAGSIRSGLGALGGCGSEEAEDLIPGLEVDSLIMLDCSRIGGVAGAESMVDVGSGEGIGVITGREFGVAGFETDVVGVFVTGVDLSAVADGFWAGVVAGVVAGLEDVPGVGGACFGFFSNIISVGRDKNVVEEKSLKFLKFNPFFSWTGVLTGVGFLTIGTSGCFGSRAFSISFGSEAFSFCCGTEALSGCCGSGTFSICRGSGVLSF